MFDLNAAARLESQAADLGPAADGPKDAAAVLEADKGDARAKACAARTAARTLQALPSQV